MNAKNNQEIDELTQFLLNKCEVTSLTHFYHKWVQEIDHSVPIKNICAIHKNFNEPKIIKDIADIPDLLIINVPDYTQKKDLSREQFVIDAQGLGKILKSLKRLRIIKKTVPLSTILTRLGADPDKNEKVLTLIKKAIEERALYAHILNLETRKDDEEILIKFYSKIRHPDHRTDFIKLMVTLAILLISLGILLPIIYMVNA